MSSMLTQEQPFWRRIGLTAFFHTCSSKKCNNADERAVHDIYTMFFHKLNVWKKTQPMKVSCEKCGKVQFSFLKAKEKFALKP